MILQEFVNEERNIKKDMMCLRITIKISYITWTRNEKCEVISIIFMEEEN